MGERGCDVTISFGYAQTGSANVLVDYNENQGCLYFASGRAVPGLLSVSRVALHRDQAFFVGNRELTLFFLVGLLAHVSRYLASSHGTEAAHRQTWLSSSVCLFPCFYAVVVPARHSILNYPLNCFRIPAHVPSWLFRAPREWTADKSAAD